MLNLFLNLPTFFCTNAKKNDQIDQCQAAVTAEGNEIASLALISNTSMSEYFESWGLEQILINGVKICLLIYYKIQAIHVGFI